MSRAVRQFRVALPWLVALVLSTVVVSGASLCPVHAAPPAANPPGYDATIDEALAAFDAGRFVEARELFLRAHKILPSARTLRAMGKAEYELKRFDEAATHLKLALDSDVRPLTNQQRGETAVLLRKSEDFLATYTLRLDPPDAALKLDGASVGTDSNGALRLIAGVHLLEAEAPDYQPWRRELSVQARVDTVLSVSLRRLSENTLRARASLDPVAPVIAPAVAVDDPAPFDQASGRSDVSPSRRRWLLWGSLGALVVAGVVTGVVIALNQPDSPHATGGSTGMVWRLDPSRN